MSSMTLTHSSRLSASKPQRNNGAEREQNLHYSQYNGLRRPHNLAKPLHGDLKELFEISGLWVRNVGERHALKLQIRRLIRRIVERIKVGRRNRRPVRRLAR